MRVNITAHERHYSLSAKYNTAIIAESAAIMKARGNILLVVTAHTIKTRLITAMRGMITGEQSLFRIVDTMRFLLS